MNRYRGPAFGGPSKATPQTLCQKCLKRDKFKLAYECKAQTQERPYASRPSRTQQLLNPKLAPKLTSDLPNALQSKKDLTEEILGKDRSNRKSKGDDGDGMDYIGGRRRSISASPFSSGSATSTDDSRGSSVRGEDKYYHSQQSPSILRKEIGTRKRRRSLTSSERSLSSEPSEREARPISRDQERNTRARRGLLSPDERGRRRSRSREGRKRGRSRSRTRSVHRGHTTRVSRSVTPHRPTRQDAWFDSPRERGHYDREIEHIGRRNRSDQTRHDSYDERGRNNGRREEESRKENQTRPPPKERSLSPFSKRLALTQAMNMGR